MRTLFLMLFLAPLARTADLFDEANAAYDAGRFREAAESYESLLLRDGPRVTVLQNLGSAYHRLGEDGRAILAFERALLLDPGDPDLMTNLKLVRDRAAVFPAESGDAWSKVTDRLTRRQWSGIELGGAVLLPLAALGWLWLRGRNGRGWMIPLAAVGAVLIALAIAALRTTSGVRDRGIIVADLAKVRISPFESAEEKGTLPGGREVRLGQEKDGWFRVSADGGASEGWVADGEVEPLLPR